MLKKGAMRWYRCSRGRGVCLIQVAGNHVPVGFFDEDIVADFKALQAVINGPSCNFNAGKFQMLFPSWQKPRYARISGSAVYHQADHDELAVFKARRSVTGAGKVKRREAARKRTKTRCVPSCHGRFYGPVKHPN